MTAEPEVPLATRAQEAPHPFSGTRNSTRKLPCAGDHSCVLRPVAGQQRHRDSFPGDERRPRHDQRCMAEDGQLRLRTRSRAALSNDSRRQGRRRGCTPFSSVSSCPFGGKCTRKAGRAAEAALPHAFGLGYAYFGGVTWICMNPPGVALLIAICVPVCGLSTLDQEACHRPSPGSDAVQ